MVKLRIQELQRSDLAHRAPLCHLFMESRLETKFDYRSVHEKTLWRSLALACEPSKTRSTITVAWLKRKPVAYSESLMHHCPESNKAYALATIFVLPGFRKNGYGHELASRLKQDNDDVSIKSILPMRSADVSHEIYYRFAQREFDINRFEPRMMFARDFGPSEIEGHRSGIKQKRQIKDRRRLIYSTYPEMRQNRSGNLKVRVRFAQNDDFAFIRSCENSLNDHLQLTEHSVSDLGIFAAIDHSDPFYGIYLILQIEETDLLSGLKSILDIGCMRSYLEFNSITGRFRCYFRRSWIEEAYRSQGYFKHFIGGAIALMTPEGERNIEGRSLIPGYIQSQQSRIGIANAFTNNGFRFVSKPGVSKQIDKIQTLIQLKHE